MRKRSLAVGHRYGNLVVLADAENIVRSAGGGKTRQVHCVLVRCDCGTEKVAHLDRLCSGNTTSCGCSRKSPSFRARVSAEHRTHGESTNATMSPEYRTLASIKSRCLNPGNHAYSYYGGRGITVCERWLGGVEAFIEDMGRRPSNKHSIDRINNNGNYEPGNCRWATRKEQSRNRRPYSEWVFKKKRKPAGAPLALEVP